MAETLDTLSHLSGPQPSGYDGLLVPVGKTFPSCATGAAARYWGVGERSRPPGRSKQPGNGEVVRGRANGSARNRYAALVRELAHLEVDEAEAESLWRAVRQHRRTLHRRLGRDVGRCVALLDYLVNLRAELQEPRIMERAVVETIERQAIGDALTGLFNRYHFETQLDREIERARRYNSRLSLLLLDLDRFKEINDHCGHQVGDAVLETVGALLLEHVRSTDVPCRYGGDEFAVILPDTSLGRAAVMAERIREAVASRFRGWTVAGQLVTVTVSGGVASTGELPLTAERLISRADKDLYRAKAAGGDRVLSPLSGISAHGGPSTARAG